jgi:uncharacterized alpha-E superfamily protein
MGDSLAVEGIARATYSGNDGFSLLRGGIVSERAAKTMRVCCESSYQRTKLQRLLWGS